MKRTKEHVERQEEELQVLQAIYMDDFQDLRTEVSDSVQYMICSRGNYFIKFTVYFVKIN